jgi:hypothetical protein
MHGMTAADVPPKRMAGALALRKQLTVLFSTRVTSRYVTVGCANVCQLSFIAAVVTEDGVMSCRDAARSRGHMGWMLGSL